MAPLGAYIGPDLRVNASQLGEMVSAYTFAGMFGALIYSRYADRWNKRSALIWLASRLGRTLDLLCQEAGERVAKRPLSLRGSCCDSRSVDNMDELEQNLGLLAEMALGARDLHEFDLAWFELLRPNIGFDTACSVWTNQRGVTLHAAALGYSEGTLRERFTLFMGELTELEVAGFSCGKPALDTDVVSASRRQQLSVYRELLIPANVRCFTTSVWHSRWGVFGFHLARCKGASNFRGRELEKLARLIQGVKIGQALLAADQLRGLSDSDWWRQAWNLSARESDVAQLAARGLTNPEIARLLRVSPLTVRNQLVAVFRKACVASRAELVFAMNSPVSQQAERERMRRSPPVAWSAFLERGR